MQAAGVVQPVQSAELDFPNSGQVTAIYVSVGSHVAQGDVLATQNIDDAVATLSSDQARLTADQSNLQALLGGAQPAAGSALAGQIASAKSTLQTAQSTSAATAQADAAALSAAQQKLTGAKADGNTALTSQLYGEIQQLSGAQQADAATQQASVARAQAALATLQAEEAVGRSSGSSTTASEVATAVAAIATDQSTIITDSGALDNSVLRAPFAGVVAAIGGSVGDLDTNQGVKQSSESSPVTQQPSSSVNLLPSVPQQQTQSTPSYESLFTLQTTATKVVAQVGETDIAKVRLGQLAHVSFPAIAGSNYSAVVTKIQPTAVQQNGAAYFLVDLQLQQARGQDGATVNGTPLVGLTADVTF